MKLHSGSLILGAGLLAMGIAASAFAPTSVANTLTYFFIIIVFVLGLGLYVGNTGILSFGHPIFMAVAAYATAVLSIPVARKAALFPNLPASLSDVALPPFVSGTLAMGLALVMALGIAVALARLSGAAATIATLGLLIMMHALLVGDTTFTRGAQAVFGVPQTVAPWGAALAAAAALALCETYKRSRSGLLARAVREDEPAARSIGISVTSTRTQAFLVSSGLVALAGVLFAHHLAVFSPREFYFSLSFSTLAMLIVGGATSVTGALAGAALITALTEVLRRVEPGFEVAGFQTPTLFGLTTIGISVALLVTLYRRPEGLLGDAELSNILPGYERTLPTRRPTRRAVSPAPQEPISGTLKATSLTKRYGGVTALDAVSFELRTGEILGLIGPNGSGKSTLLSCISGLQSYDAGQVHLDGLAIAQGQPERIAQRGVGRTFQNIRLFNALSVGENIAAASLSGAAAPRGRSVGDILQRVGLSDVADQPANALSYGGQRRLEIGRALALGPAFLLLDEPAAGMNSVETRSLSELLRRICDEDGIGMLLVDHDVPMIMAVCDRVAVLNEGRLIASGTPDAVRDDPAVAAAYFGKPLPNDV